MSKRTYSVPIHSALQTRGEWQASMSAGPDPVFSFSLRPIRQWKEGDTERAKRDPLRVCDVFELRTEFFAIRTPGQALEFFQAFGPWQVEQPLSIVANAIPFSAVTRRRHFYEDALLNRSIEYMGRKYSGDDVREGLENIYLWHPLPIELLFGQPLVGRVLCKDIEDSLRASVFLDRLNGFTWRRCARADCGKLFSLSSKRERLYCDTECAHLQAVRNYNDRKRIAKLASRQKPKRAPGKKGTTK